MNSKFKYSDGLKYVLIELLFLLKPVLFFTGKYVMLKNHGYIFR